MVYVVPSDTSIPFHWFVLLINRLGSVPAKRKCSSMHPSKLSHRLGVLREWIAELRSTYPCLPRNTIMIFFRLFFPEEDYRRRYNLKEAALAKLVCQIFGLHGFSKGRAKRLVHWNSSYELDVSSGLGCLGDEVAETLREVAQTSEKQQCNLTFQQVDQLLDELASKSPWSNLYQKPSARSRTEILKDIFGNSCPSGARVLTQVILQDMRPVLYPTKELHSTTALLQFNSASVSALTKWEVMKEWDLFMPKLYRVQASLDAVARIIDDFEDNSRPRGPLGPEIGIPLEIPKSRKGRSCSDALNSLMDSKTIWAETKYDGERMQIHVDLKRPAGKQIQIFSKSKRDSTVDRIGTHSIVLAAVQADEMKSRIRETAILDAEMVPFSDFSGKIEEFWRIRDIYARTPGSTRSNPVAIFRPTQFSERPELEAEFRDSLHFMVVFFDIVYKDGTSYLGVPYNERRKVLENSISCCPGYAMLADRFPIAVGSHSQRVASLRDIFASHIANHKEGLVLKASESVYHDWSLPWVKLKRDYIPGYGDTADLIAFGACWDKDRGRELRVAPGTWTTFYMGLLDCSPGSCEPDPHIQFLFTVSYGLDRQQLEQLNFTIRSMDMEAPLSYTYSLRKNIPAPAVVFARPLIMELYGAGFTKSDHTDLYELRFPRIVKYFDPQERGMTEAISLSEFQRLARHSAGVERPYKEVDDRINQDWDKPCSPGVNSSITVSRRTSEWSALLKHADLGQSPPKEKLHALSTGTLLASVSPREKVGPVGRAMPAPLATLSLNVLPSFRLTASEMSKHSLTCVKRKNSLFPSPKPRKRICTKSLIGNKEAPERLSFGKFSESFGFVGLALMNDSQRHQDFMDPRQNEHLYTPLAQFLLHSQIWVDPELAGPSSSGRITNLQVVKILPPGCLTYWIGAFFESFGLKYFLKKNYNNFRSRSGKKGVLFVCPSNEARIAALLTEKLEGDEARPLPQITLLPGKFLLFPPRSTRELEEGILWNTSHPNS